MFRFVVIVVFLLSFVFCSEKAQLRRQVRNTINACGFTTDTLKMFKATKSELHVYDLKPNETIADIGFGTAWLIGVILIQHDSLHIYANDIDDASIKAIHPIAKKYLSLRNKPNTNSLVVVKGGFKNTNLPTNTFDKIIIRETFHHFESRLFIRYS